MQGGQDYLAWSNPPLFDQGAYFGEAELKAGSDVLANRREVGPDRLVAYPRPQVIFQYYDGFTGDLLYAESILGGKHDEE